MLNDQVGNSFISFPYTSILLNRYCYRPPPIIQFFNRSIILISHHYINRVNSIFWQKASFVDKIDVGMVNLGQFTLSCLYPHSNLVLLRLLLLLLLPWSRLLLIIFLNLLFLGFFLLILASVP